MFFDCANSSKRLTWGPSENLHVLLNAGMLVTGFLSFQDLLEL
jgi:hypothetical protein